jgi:hypothetical protein
VIVNPSTYFAVLGFSNSRITSSNSSRCMAVCVDLFLVSCDGRGLELISFSVQSIISLILKIFCRTFTTSEIAVRSVLKKRKEDKNDVKKCVCVRACVRACELVV